MKIFRFEKNETNRLETIKNREIYLSSPNNFNDLDDCRIQGISSPEHEFLYEKIKKCVEILYPENSENEFPLSKNIFDLLKEVVENLPSSCDSSDQELRRSLFRNAAVAQIRKSLRETTAVCCFFKDAPKHPLMWAHYANSHTGFCIEYELDEISAPLYEVSYSNKLPSPSIKELLFCPEESFIKILTTKSLEWSYEKEVRFLILNSLKNEESGKAISLPDFMRPARIIKGEKFDHAENRDLIESLEMKITLYRNM